MATREKAVPIDQEILERLNRGILHRTGAYRTDEHIVLRSGRHTSEYVAKALVTTEPTFTEGLGDIIAGHFSRYQVDLVLTTGYGAGLLGHCVARAHPSRPRFIFATKGKTADRTRTPARSRRWVRSSARGALSPRRRGCRVAPCGCWTF